MNAILITPLFASGALQFAFEKATTEGKMTIGVLTLVSLFSWTVIISKLRQILRARKMTRKFMQAYAQGKDPLDLQRQGTDFSGAPLFEVYRTGATILNDQMELVPADAQGRRRITESTFALVRTAMERAVSGQAMALEKGMIVLSTAVSGGPFIGLLGTVWGVMDTFSGVAKANAASLTAMAPGVAGALIATVIGLLVAIPAMFAYNFMVTTIRAITQEMDDFTAEYAVHLEHRYVKEPRLAEEIAAALQGGAGTVPDRTEPELALR